MCSKEQEFIKVNSETPSTVWPPSKSQLAHHKLKTISTGRLFGVTLIFPAHQLNCTNSKPILMHDMDDDWTLSDGSSEGWGGRSGMWFSLRQNFGERQQWCQSLCWEEILLQRTLLPLSMKSNDVLVCPRLPVYSTIKVDLEDSNRPNRTYQKANVCPEWEVG